MINVLNYTDVSNIFFQNLSRKIFGAMEKCFLLLFNEIWVYPSIKKVMLLLTEDEIFNS